MARKRQMEKTARKRRGGAWLDPSTWASFFRSAPPDPPLASTSLPGSNTTAQSVVAPVTNMATTAGKRMNRLLGGDTTSPNVDQKLLGTAREGSSPPLLGGRRRRRRTLKKFRKSRK
jgi:hypothetical protein